MNPHRGVKPLPIEQLLRFNAGRLRAYRNKVLSLRERPWPPGSAFEEPTPLDDRYIWFKSDARWRPLVDAIAGLLVLAQTSEKAVVGATIPTGEPVERK